MSSLLNASMQSKAMLAAEPIQRETSARSRFGARGPTWTLWVSGESAPSRCWGPEGDERTTPRRSNEAAQTWKLKVRLLMRVRIYDRLVEVCHPDIFTLTSAAGKANLQRTPFFRVRARARNG